jgi:polysaccharide deacetylase family protein (PEP-CTERM system associated)
MAKTILEDLSGSEVRGYRAPSFSIGRDSLWGHEVLAEVGYKYSSSIYPIQHDHYGLPEAPRFVYRPEAVPGLIELPITTVVINGQNYPAGGGGYFRLLPYWMSRWGIRAVNRRDRRPCIFYFHPWEIDPEQPQQKNIGLKTRFRHYVNLGRMKRKLDKLMCDFYWDRIDRVFPEVAA